MLRALISFYLLLLSQAVLTPSWLENQTPDKLHFHRRRFTAKYKQKQRIVRGLWFAVCALILAFPFLQFAIAMALLATFVSFCILDETE